MAKKKSSTKEMDIVVDDEFLGKPSDGGDEDGSANDENFEVGDDFDEMPAQATSRVSNQNPTQESQKIVWRAMEVTTQYHDRLTTDIARVAYYVLQT